MDRFTAAHDWGEVWAARIKRNIYLNVHRSTEPPIKIRYKDHATGDWDGRTSNLLLTRPSMNCVWGCLTNLIPNSNNTLNTTPIGPLHEKLVDTLTERNTNEMKTSWQLNDGIQCRELSMKEVSIYIGLARTRDWAFVDEQRQKKFDSRGCDSTRNFILE